MFKNLNRFVFFLSIKTNWTFHFIIKMTFNFHKSYIEGYDHWPVQYICIIKNIIFRSNTIYKVYVVRHLKYYNLVSTY